MSQTKKLIRERFRTTVFERDGHRCRVCGAANAPLDAHHITDRNELPNGGYVRENGIALCPPCHEKAETFHATGVTVSGYAPDELYARIGSSRERAERASAKL